MTRGEKSPTLLRHWENFGRSGGVFGMVFASKILATEVSEDSEDFEKKIGRKKAQTGQKL